MCGQGGEPIALPIGLVSQYIAGGMVMEVKLQMSDGSRATFSRVIGLKPAFEEYKPRHAKKESADVGASTDREKK